MRCQCINYIVFPSADTACFQAVKLFISGCFYSACNAVFIPSLVLLWCFSSGFPAADTDI